MCSALSTDAPQVASSAGGGDRHAHKQALCNATSVRVKFATSCRNANAPSEPVFIECRCCAQYHKRAGLPLKMICLCAAAYLLLADSCVANYCAQVLPSAQYYKRAGFPLKKICQYATARGFTDVLVANEDRKSVNGLLLIHLPGGPTAHFRLSKLVLSKDIKVCSFLLLLALGSLSEGYNLQTSCR